MPMGSRESPTPPLKRAGLKPPRNPSDSRRSGDVTPPLRRSTECATPPPQRRPSEEVTSLRRRRTDSNDASVDGADSDREQGPTPLASLAKKERVRVAVRVRPPVRADEAAAGTASAREHNVMHCSGSTLWLLPNGEGQGGDKGQPGGGSDKAQSRQFQFDWVLGPDSQQREVFRLTCEQTHVVEGTLRGVNGCVMAYGQTGAGKTHTLSNLKEGSEGIVPQALQELFALIARESSEATAQGNPATSGAGTGGLPQVAGSWAVQLAYVQIYLENVYDLLEPSNQVDIREAPGEGASLQGNEWRPVSGYADALAAIRSGERHRVTASTSLNDASSRSHTVLVLSVRGRRGAALTHGRLFLVDLAGSERVKRSEVTGVAFDEAVAINTSLTCLGRCVAALANPKLGRPPFRDSRLTRLLSSAFGGRASTVLLVCVAPSTADLSESTAALQFGAQAMAVKVNARANATVDHRALSSQLLAELDSLETAERLAEAEALRELQPALRQLSLLQDTSYELQSELAALQLAASAAAALPVSRGALELGEGRGPAAGRTSEWGASPAGRGLPSVTSPLPGCGQGGLAEQGRLHSELARLDSAIEAARAASAQQPQPGAVGTAGAGTGEDPAAAAASLPASQRGRLARPAASPLSLAPGPGQPEPEPPADGRSLPYAAQGGAEAAASSAAVSAAWQDAARMGAERAEASERFERARLEAEDEARAMEAIESSLYDVAADLGRLALAYRASGQPAEAVPLFVSALAVYEHTLGQSHPEVAKDLVNLGNALCDLQRHAEAVPLYLRALEIDRQALGPLHPEVAMDLSNLGIALRVMGRLAEAADLFEQALAIMRQAVGEDDPRSVTIARNLTATQVIEVDVGAGRAKAPQALERRTSFSRRKAGKELAESARGVAGSMPREGQDSDRATEADMR